MREFLRGESAGGFALAAGSAVGLIWANSPLAGSYSDLLHLKLGVSTTIYGITLTTHAWVNDAFMAVFFLLVGLEIKREMLAGGLSTVRRAALPALAALGGIVVPAIVYATILWHDPQRLRGWAIPTATDIAFALAALSLLRRRIPPGLKIFLTALAVIDDLAAIVIIALFYSAGIAVAALIAAVACLALLALLNRLRVTVLAPYLAVGVVMWFCVSESGVHATLAGVALAFAVPTPSLRRLEHALNPYVAFVVLPLFGVFNAGVSFRGLQPSVLFDALPLAIAFGLFAGKQIGIFGAAWLAVRSGVGALPHGVSWRMMYGVALLGGIGFTMSLFIGTLAFESDALLTETKIGVFAGSLLAATAGYLVLRGSKPRVRAGAE